MSAFDLGTIAVQALGWCLVHFVWQATLVGALYAAARMLLPRGNARYLAAMLALIALAMLPVWTAFHEVRVLAPPVDLGAVSIIAATGSTAVTAKAVAWWAPLRVALPWLVVAWACGVVFLGVRVIRQWHGLRAIVRAAEALPVWQQRARSLGRRLGLRRAVRVLASVRIATPTLVGWARPVVVIPLAMLARMPVAQVDLILAHELAHLRRLDHIANLFQVILETVLFYHPVVHWISRDARNERELCCDALALRASGGNRHDFVSALAGLEEFRAEHADLALAASGGVLVERAWFIAGAKQQHRRARPELTVALLALLGVVIALAVAWHQNQTQKRIEDVLVSNSIMLRHELAAVTRNLPAPVLHGVVLQRPELAPLALAPGNSLPPTTGMPILPTSADMPTLSVPDLAAVSLHVAPAFSKSEKAAAGTPTDAGLAKLPRAISTVQPAYPRQALLNGLQGQVEIQFTLTAAGVPGDLQVVRSSAAGQFDAAALQALARWRFTPPTTAGRRYRQTFNFRLDAAVASDESADGACLITTGTHICRRAFDTDTGVRVLRSNP